MITQHQTDAEKFGSALADAFADAPECGAFGDVDDLSRRRMINEIIDLASETTADKQYTETLLRRSRRGPLRFVAIGAAAALILGLLGIWIFEQIPSSAVSSASHSPSYFGEVARLDGAIFFDDLPAAVNAPIPVNQSIRTASSRALLRLPTGITWQMNRRSEGRIAALTSNRLRVDVRSGTSWFKVDPTRRGPTFYVVTPKGRIDVTGTIFVVNADEDEVSVTLLKGEVWVTRPNGEKTLVKTGHVMHMDQNRQHPLSPSDRQQMTAQLATVFDAETPSTAATAEQTSIDTDASLPLDGTPLRTQIKKRRHFSQTSSQLLSAIRTQRKQRNWGKVAELYKKLIQSAPDSETATVSRVSLGEIYLTKLQQHNDALTQFNKYLQSGHTALLPEAYFGRCNALRALGRRKGEKQCLDNFITQFSEALQVPKAKIRLDAIRKREAM